MFAAIWDDPDVWTYQDHYHERGRRTVLLLNSPAYEGGVDGGTTHRCAAFAILAMMAAGCTAKTAQGAPDVPLRTTAPTTTVQPIASSPTTVFVPATTTPATTTMPAATTPATTVARAPVEATTTSAPGAVALDVLAAVVVEKEHPAGYDRALFGYPADLDGDQCDTRSEVLQRDSITSAQVDPYGCTVVAGDWLSAYDGLAFTSPGDLEIDHVVALKEAWDSGAWAWTAETRTAYANDLSDTRTLRAVSVSTNRSKGDRDPSNWLPPDPTDVCTYITDWVAIKTRWGLSMDSSEFGRINNLLGDQCLGSVVAPSSPAIVSIAPVPTAPPTSPPPVAQPPAGVYYANCTAARAAGAAPLHVGEPGYRSALDRDKDGIACE